MNITCCFVTIISHLRAELLQGTAEEVLRAVSLIDTVVDEAIAQCFKSYVKQRFGGTGETTKPFKFNCGRIEAVSS